jgi:hypothetical protein
MLHVLVMAVASLVVAGGHVGAGTVCSVQGALRHGGRAWTARECSDVAAALDATGSFEKFLAIAVLESDLRGGAVVEHPPRPDGRRVLDVGLMGIRCLADGRGRCTNGEARGLTVGQLLDPATSVRTAAAVLRGHGGSLDAYNGCSGSGHRRCRYGDKVAALVVALGGVEVRVSGARLRELVRRVAGAVRKSRRS